MSLTYRAFDIFSFYAILTVFTESSSITMRHGLSVADATALFAESIKTDKLTGLEGCITNKIISARIKMQIGSSQVCPQEQRFSEI
jgi:hypothetical protein